MTIRKGEPWGEQVPAPPGLEIVRSNTELHRWIVDHRRAGTLVPPVGLAGGDLARTVSGGSGSQFEGSSIRLSLDLVRVEAGDQVSWSAAHVVARRSWWSGQVWFTMTAEFLGNFDVSPRGHPNDGRVDVLSVPASLPVRVRAQARSRARTGSHLPHPQLSFRQVDELTADFARPLTLHVDGTRWITARAMHLTVEPDAYTAFV